MTKKVKKKYDKWSKNRMEASEKYFQAMETVTNGDFLSFSNLVLAVEAERKIAFEAGFYTAVQLLIGGERV
ncbi:MAG: hypothetical protein K2J32_11840 [Ruminococcus sp.]|nr:hypothetical protein [Ruminococcus sp.]